MSYRRHLDDDEESVISLSRPSTSMSSASSTISTRSNLSQAPRPRELTLEEQEARRVAAAEREERVRRFMKGVASIPVDLKANGRLVACMICSLIKSQEEFEEKGCDNCERILKVAGQRGSPYLYTSENYEGMIGLLSSKDSWVAKYQHLDSLKIGIYAVSVRGQLSSDIRQELEMANKYYHNRDKSIGNDALKQGDLEMDADVTSKRRAVRKIRRQQRRVKKSLKKAEKKKTKKAASSSASAVGSDNDDDVDQEPPSLTIIHGELEGGGADVLQDYESGASESDDDLQSTGRNTWVISDVKLSSAAKKENNSSDEDIRDF